MSRVTKKECWNILEDRLNAISENRCEKHIGEAKFAVAILVSYGRDKDIDRIESNLFTFYCRLARLHSSTTKELILNTLHYLKQGGTAKFKQAALGA